MRKTEIYYRLLFTDKYIEKFGDDRIRFIQKNTSMALLVDIKKIVQDLINYYYEKSIKLEDEYRNSYAKGGEIFMEVDLRGINDEDYFDERDWKYKNHPTDLATKDLFKLLSKNGIEINNTKKWGTKGYGEELVNDKGDKQTHHIYRFSLNDVKNKDKFLSDLNKLSDKHKVLSTPQKKFRFAKGGRLDDGSCEYEDECGIYQQAIRELALTQFIKETTIIEYIDDLQLIGLNIPEAKESSLGGK